jgi:hypothetical protein
MGDLPATQSHLAGNVDVGNVLVLAKEGKMEENSEPRKESISCAPRVKTITYGEVSAASTMSSEIPRLSVLVASLAPFFNCL